MDFQFELADLLSRVPGALGVLLLDWDGETVEAMDCTGSVHEIKVLGAYQGIFLNGVKVITSSNALGACQEFTLRLGNETFLTRILPEGYYLTMVLGEEGHEGLARREIGLAAEKIARILF